MADNNAHAQTYNAYNFCLSENSTKFIRMFMGQYLKGNNVQPKENHNAHAQISNASNSNLS